MADFAFEVAGILFRLFLGGDVIAPLLAARACVEVVAARFIAAARHAAAVLADVEM